MLTDETIRTADQIVNESGNSKGRELLKLAIRLQEQARHLSNQGIGDDNTAAIKLTIQAREKAREAMAACRKAEENEILVLRQLEKTDRLIILVSAIFPKQTGTMVTSAQNSAEENQRRAWEFYHNRQLRPALKLSREAERSFQKLWEHIRSKCDRTRHLKNQINQTESHLERVRKMLPGGDNEKAAQIYTKAFKSFGECLDFCASHDYKNAEIALNKTMQFLESIADLFSDQNTAYRLIELLKEDIESSKGIKSCGNSKAIELYKSALNYLQSAEKFRLESNTGSCAANIKAAQINLQKAKELTGL